MNFQYDTEHTYMNMQIDVLHEDEEVLVIHKPAGVLVHGDGINTSETVVDWLLSRAPEVRGVGEPGNAKDGTPLERSGVVHRLDRETSGVLVLAKTQPAYEHLKQQFHDRLAKKEYRAFVYGHMPEQRGTIDRPIGRSAKDPRRRSAERGAKGTLRDAVTEWECLTNGEYDGELFAYISLRPQTGRTHQLRVHCKAIGRPIVGDALYAGKRFATSTNLMLDRLALHAHTLDIELPNGDHRQFTAPVPDAFAAAAQLAV